MRLDWACDHLQAGNAAKLKQIAAYLKKHHDAMEPLSIPYVAALTDEDIADAVTMKYKVLRKAYLDRSNKKLYFDGGEEKLAEFERESDPESSDEDDDDDEDGEASDNAEAGSRKRKKRASKPKPTAQEIAKIRAGKEAAMADARKANASKLQGRRTAKAEYRAGGREALAAGHAYQDAKYDGCFVQQLQSDDEDPQDDSNNGCYETVANPWESEVSRAVKQACDDAAAAAIRASGKKSNYRLRVRTARTRADAGPPRILDVTMRARRFMVDAGWYNSHPEQKDRANIIENGVLWGEPVEDEAVVAYEARIKIKLEEKAKTKQTAQQTAAKRRRLNQNGGTEDAE
ncbi:hypothetical protein EXIGLDRAFT_721486 [Exidia glandulosa HHB12029]|uniref:Uncharacterized protein n=1 Tax=Exidia glandulosa HHB12029 TaxID=1314781 RepID=A0A165FQU3_EXIGL|nr:hypothetical protein EXIGLDRAFT_721486 [Exidia glandulosa HHB12029]